MENINQKGFSLIELLLVVVIIGIIAAIAIPSLNKARAAAENSAAISAMKTMNVAQSTVYTQKNRYARFDEINSVQNGNLGTFSSPNTLTRGKYTYEMIPAVPTDTELKTGFTIKATRTADSLGVPFVLQMDQSGSITQITP